MYIPKDPECVFRHHINKAQSTRVYDIINLICAPIHVPTDDRWRPLAEKVRPLHLFIDLSGR